MSWLSLRRRRKNGPKEIPLAQRVKPRRRLHITREGWFFIFICIAIGMAAIRSGNNLLFLVLGVMLGLIIASGVLSELSLRGLEFDRHPPLTLHAARPFLMGIAITNNKSTFPSFSIEVEDIQSDRVLDKRCYFLKIPSGRTQSTSYRHAFARRGRYLLAGFKVSTKFPFALLRKSRIIELRSEVVVLPSIRPVTLPPLPAPDSYGSRERRMIGRGGDIYALRDFRPGDDPREIHWKVTAHRRRLVVRERDAESVQEVALRLDNGLQVSPETSFLRAAEGVERAIIMTASLAAELIERGYRVSLVTRGGATVPADAGPAHLQRLLTFLALLEYTDPAAVLPAPHSVAPLIHIDPEGQVSLAGPGQPTSGRVAA